MRYFPLCGAISLSYSPKGKQGESLIQVVEASLSPVWTLRVSQATRGYGCQMEELWKDFQHGEKTILQAEK